MVIDLLLNKDQYQKVSFVLESCKLDHVKIQHVIETRDKSLLITDSAIELEQIHFLIHQGVYIIGIGIQSSDFIYFLPEQYTPIELIQIVNLYKKLFEYESLIKEVAKFSQETKKIVTEFRKTTELVENIQKKYLTSRFTELKKIECISKYIVGENSGSDFFDVQENKKFINIVFSRSSTYGLSSIMTGFLIAELSKLMTENHLQTFSKIAKRFFLQVQSFVKPEENLSLFFGKFYPQDGFLEYILYGDIHLYIEKQHKGWMIWHEHSPIHYEYKNEFCVYQQYFVNKDRFILFTGNNEWNIEPMPYLKDWISSFMRNDARKQKQTKSDRSILCFEIKPKLFSLG